MSFSVGGNEMVIDMELLRNPMHTFTSYNCTSLLTSGRCSSYWQVRNIGQLCSLCKFTQHSLLKKNGKKRRLYWSWFDERFELWQWINNYVTDMGSTVMAMKQCSNAYGIEKQNPKCQVRLGRINCGSSAYFEAESTVSCSKWRQWTSFVFWCSRTSVESLYLPNQWEKASVKRLWPKSMWESLCWKIMTQINGKKPLLKDYDPDQWEKLLLKDYYPDQWESATATVVPLRVKREVFYGLLGNHKTHSLNKCGLWFIFKL